MNGGATVPLNQDTVPPVPQGVSTVPSGDRVASLAQA